MKLFFIFLLVIILFLQVSMDGAAMEETLFKKFPPRRINCGYACARRCSKASRKNVCHRTCRACCARCNCVPPGTYGHKQVCPCYAHLTTRGNKPKCP